MQLFEQASAKLQTPKVTFPKYTLYRAGKSSKYPGAVYISPVDRAGWYGRIETDGSLTLNRGLSLPGLEAELQKFAANPAQYAADYGKQSGNCCFCCLPIERPESLSVGYGAKCALNFGLPHPLNNKKDSSPAKKSHQSLRS